MTTTLGRATKQDYLYLGLVWDQPAQMAAGFTPRCTFRFESAKTAARTVRQAVAAGSYHAAIEMLTGAGHRQWRSLAHGGDAAFRTALADGEKFFLVDYQSTGTRPPSRLADPKVPARYGRGPADAARPRGELTPLSDATVSLGEDMFTVIDVMSLAGL